MATSVQNFYQDFKRYPTNAEGFNVLVSARLPTPHAPYIEAPLPLDDWGHSFVYRNYESKVGNVFAIISAGPDGVLGTSDDIVFRNDGESGPLIDEQMPPATRAK